MATSLEVIHAAPVRAGRRRALGVLSYLFGCLCSLGAVSLFFSFVVRAPEPLQGAIGAVLAMGAGFLSLVMAERFFVPSVGDVLDADPRAPVLYLRPFGEDAVLTYDVLSSGESVSTTSAKAEDFLLALNAIGPLVSIAEPDRLARWGMHPLGAHRDYIGDGDWQARVIDLLERADLVVLALGDSPGIEWEIEQVRQRVRPEQLLIYLPPRPNKALTTKGRHAGDRELYAHFVPLVEKHFGVAMPPFSESIYLIGFTPEGLPIMAPDAPRRSWVFTEHARVADAIGSQLKVLLAQLRPGLDLKHFAIAGRSGSWWRVGGVACLIALAMGLGVLGVSPDETLFYMLAINATKLAGWVMIARYFGKRWVWILPVLAVVTPLVSLSAQYAEVLVGVGTWDVVRHPVYRLLSAGLNMAGALALLMLGVSLVGRRAR